MTVILLLLTFGFFLTIDTLKTAKKEECGTTWFSPEFGPQVGWTAADGGEKVKK